MRLRQGDISRASERSRESRQQLSHFSTGFSVSRLHEQPAEPRSFSATFDTEFSTHEDTDGCRLDTEIGLFEKKNSQPLLCSTAVQISIGHYETHGQIRLLNDNS